MNSIKMTILCSTICLLAGCYPHRFNYQQGPTEFSIVVSGKTPAASVRAARQKAVYVCAFNDRDAKELHISTTPSAKDKVKVVNNYFYVIQERPAKRFFTVLNYICVPRPPKQYYSHTLKYTKTVEPKIVPHTF